MTIAKLFNRSKAQVFFYLYLRHLRYLLPPGILPWCHHGRRIPKEVRQKSRETFDTYQGKRRQTCQPIQKGYLNKYSKLLKEHDVCLITIYLCQELICFNYCHMVLLYHYEEAFFIIRIDGQILLQRSTEKGDNVHSLSSMYLLCTHLGIVDTQVNEIWIFTQEAVQVN